METELYELCKEVAEKTGWGGTDYYFCSGVKMHRTQMDDDDLLGMIIPIYSSDYLLEKLPAKIVVDDKYTNEAYLEMRKDPYGYKYSYESYYFEPWNSYYETFADTPDIALLRLTGTLFDEGVIKEAGDK